ncbi:hypothetical protein V466_07780 [Pseudomonas mandelii PD30]|uniref:Uncharacterized protein n=1 Tax=Pseudomonas mandelii PD30 TaxID=1419583 RepID=A0A059L6G2_9PSED|nr:hypothetical protein V466_07780 [Pseudomonas mandelii PD30]
MVLPIYFVSILLVAKMKIIHQHLNWSFLALYLVGSGVEQIS